MHYSRMGSLVYQSVITHRRQVFHECLQGASYRLDGFGSFLFSFFSCTKTLPLMARTIGAKGWSVS